MEIGTFQTCHNPPMLSFPWDTYIVGDTCICLGTHVSPGIHVSPGYMYPSASQCIPVHETPSDSIRVSSTCKSWRSMENVQNSSSEVSRAVPGRSQRVDPEFWSEGAPGFVQKWGVQNGPRTFPGTFFAHHAAMISTDFLRRRFAT